MIVLDSTLKSLEVVLAAAPAVTQPTIVTSYVDNTTSTYVPGAQDSAANGTTPVTIVSAPGSGTRAVKLIALNNADATEVAATVSLNDNGTLRTLWSGALAPTATLLYTDRLGFYVASDGGSILHSMPTHGLLSVLHSDDIPFRPPYRGALIVGSPTASSAIKWGDLQIGTALKVVQSDGVDAAWQRIAASSISTIATPVAQTFTVDGTWTKPTGVTLIRVDAWGAGGGGGGGAVWKGGSGNPGCCGGSGGGGGAFASKIFLASDVTSPVSVTVGIGGPGGASVTTSSGTSRRMAAVRDIRATLVHLVRLVLEEVAH